MHNEPRTLDVDLIVVGDRRADDDDLQPARTRAPPSAPSCWSRGTTSSPTRRSPTLGPVAELLEKTDRSGVTRRDDLTLEIQ